MPTQACPDLGVFLKRVHAATDVPSCVFDRSLVVKPSGKNRYDIYPVGKRQATGTVLLRSGLRSVIGAGHVLGRKIGGTRFLVFSRDTAEWKVLEFAPAFLPPEPGGTQYLLKGLKQVAVFRPPVRPRENHLYPTVGNFLAPFRLGACIGQGGNGRVYRIVGVSDQVVKITGDLEYSHWFGEVRMFLELPRGVHPGLLDYAVVRRRGQPSTGRVVMRMQRLPATMNEVLTCGNQQEVAQALEERWRAVADAGYLCWDQKPSNIMFDSSQRLYLVDLDYYEKPPGLTAAERCLVMELLFSLFVLTRYPTRPYRTLLGSLQQRMQALDLGLRQTVHRYLFGQVGVYLQTFYSYWWDDTVYQLAEKHRSEAHPLDEGAFAEVARLQWPPIEDERELERYHPLLLQLVRPLSAYLLDLE